MSNYRLVVMSNPVAGREDEYNEWYTNQHLADVINIPGITAAQRFKVKESVTAPNDPPAHNYMAIYDIETDELSRTLGELQTRPGTAAMPMSEAIDMAGASGTIFEVFTPRMESTTK